MQTLQANGRAEYSGIDSATSSLLTVGYNAWTVLAMATQLCSYNEPPAWLGNFPYVLFVYNSAGGVPSYGLVYPVGSGETPPALGGYGLTEFASWQCGNYSGTSFGPSLETPERAIFAFLNGYV